MDVYKRCLFGALSLTALSALLIALCYLLPDEETSDAVGVGYAIQYDSGQDDFDDPAFAASYLSDSLKPEAIAEKPRQRKRSSFFDPPKTDSIRFTGGDIVRAHGYGDSVRLTNAIIASTDEDWLIASVDTAGQIIIGIYKSLSVRFVKIKSVRIMYPERYENVFDRPDSVVLLGEDLFVYPSPDTGYYYFWLRVDEWPPDTTKIF